MFSVEQATNICNGYINLLRVKIIYIGDKNEVNKSI